MRMSFSRAAIVLFAIIAACSRGPTNQAQGYIEGRYTYMASSVSGVLKELLVKRGTQVKQGEKLFVLEEQPEIDAYNAAVENLQQSVAARDAIAANLNYAQVTYERYKILVTKNVIQQAQLDNARAAFEAQTAQLAQANSNIASTTATLRETRWSTEQKVISAPLDAIVFDTYYRVGEYTKASQPIVSLLAPSDIKVIFYVSEPVLRKLKLGDKVSVRCETCSHAYTGKISFISPTAEYTPPVIFSNETNYKLI